MKTLGFRAAVLKPDLDLRFREIERRAELGPFCDGKVLLLTELPFQSQQLGRGKGGPRLSVCLVFPECALLWIDSLWTDRA